MSVTERTNLYRREHQKEAMVWQQRGSRDSEVEVQDADEEKTAHAEVQQEVSGGALLCAHNETMQSAL